MDFLKIPFMQVHDIQRLRTVFQRFLPLLVLVRRINTRADDEESDRPNDNSSDDARFSFLFFLIFFSVTDCRVAVVIWTGLMIVIVVIYCS